MTAPVGNLGAEIETGGRELGQSAPRLASKGGTNWLTPSGGSLATGLATAAPTFRSSWQAVLEAWRGVSRGTNSINNLQEEIGTNAEANGTESAQTPNKLQTASLAPSAAKLPGARIAAQPNTSVHASTTQTEAQVALNRSQLRQGQDAITPALSGPNIASDAMDLPGAEGRSVTESRSARQNGENSAPSTKSGPRVAHALTTATAWLSVPATSLPPAAAPVTPAPTARGIGTQPETGAMPLVSESETVRPGLESGQVPGSTQPGSRQAAAILNRRASMGAQILPTDSISLSRTAPGASLHGKCRSLLSMKLRALL